MSDHIYLIYKQQSNLFKFGLNYDNYHARRKKSEFITVGMTICIGALTIYDNANWPNFAGISVVSSDSMAEPAFDPCETI